MDQLLRQILTELRGAWRFRWLAMVVTWLVALGGIVYVLSMPDQFEARSEVYVDTNDPLLATQRGGGNDAQTKVDYVRRMLLSTPNLEQVARDTDLDLRAPTPQAFQALVRGLQDKITVAPAKAGRGFDANLYEIVYRDPQRSIAERVVQVLLNSFQQQSLEGDLRDDLQALEFLDNQMAEYRRRLEEAENRVADFRRRNAGLIGSEGGFFTRLEGLKEQLRETRASLRIAQEKRAALAAQFNESEASAGNTSGATSLAELENQVLQTEKQLDELRLVYTDEHPSVISARETLAALESRLQQRREELGPLLGSAGSSGAVVENVRIALTQAEIEVTELRGRERDLEQRIGELQERIEIAPQLEAELAGLNRDHAVLRGQYESLLQRRELLSFDIDRKRQGRQLEFRIIEPPFAAQAPVAPDRFRLMLLVLVASLGAGGGIAFVLHQLKPVFVGSESVYQQLGIPVLGTVSMAWTARATWRRRSAEAVFAVGLALLLVVFGIVFATLPRITALAQQLLA
jgi:polysaccharide chain length determinant protein (PEP-CTERM system associated)